MKNVINDKKRIIMVVDSTLLTSVGLRRLEHLSKLPQLNFMVEWHIIGDDSGQKLIRHNNQNTRVYFLPGFHFLKFSPYLFRKRVKSHYIHFLKKDKYREKNNIFFVSIPPFSMSLVHEMLLDSGYYSVLDIRDIYQELIGISSQIIKNSKNSLIQKHQFGKTKGIFNLFFNKGYRFYEYILSKEQRRVLAKTRLLTYAHPYFKGYISKEVIQEARLSYISNGADGNVFLYKDTFEQKFLKEELIHIVHFGSFLPYHGLEIWIKLMTYLDPERIHLHFIGDGPLRSTLQKAVKRLGIKDRVSFLGKINHSEIPNYICSADFTVASFNPKYGGMSKIARPTKVIESLLCGTPAIFYGGGVGLKSLAELIPKSLYVFEEEPLDHLVAFFQSLKKVDKKTRENTSIQAKELLDYSLIREDFIIFLRNVFSNIEITSKTPPTEF